MLNNERSKAENALFFCSVIDKDKRNYRIYFNEFFAKKSLKVMVICLGKNCPWR